MSQYDNFEFVPLSDLDEANGVFVHIAAKRINRLIDELNDKTFLHKENRINGLKCLIQLLQENKHDCDWKETLYEKALAETQRQYEHLVSIFQSDSQTLLNDLRIEYTQLVSDPAEYLKNHQGEIQEMIGDIKKDILAFINGGKDSQVDGSAMNFVPWTDESCQDDATVADAKVLGRMGMHGSVGGESAAGGAGDFHPQ